MAENDELDLLIMLLDDMEAQGEVQVTPMSIEDLFKRHFTGGEDEW